MRPVHLSLDFRSGTPIYLQIVKEVERMVQNGDLAPGDQLPTVRQLAAEIRVNFNTVARAYRMLDEARLISTQQGRGTYILDRMDSGIDQMIKTASLDDQIRSALQKLTKQGFTQEEIIQELKNIVDEGDFSTQTEED